MCKTYAMRLLSKKIDIVYVKRLAFFVGSYPLLASTHWHANEINKILDLCKGMIETRKKKHVKEHQICSTND